MNEFKKMSTSTIALIVVASIIFVTFLSLIGMYNGLVDSEEDVKEARANVETMMQRRFELIPDLVEVTKEAAAFEERVYKEIANARNSLNQIIENGGSNDEIDEANKQLTIAIDNYMNFIVENYPTIAATEQFGALQDELAGSVNRITVARENYNEAVSDHNRKIRKFPYSMLAGMFGFESFEEFEVDEEASSADLVDFGGNTSN